MISKEHALDYCTRALERGATVIRIDRGCNVMYADVAVYEGKECAPVLPYPSDGSRLDEGEAK